MKNDMTGEKRVLHIIQGFGAGGAETWLLALVKYLHLHPHINFKFDFLIAGGKPLLYDEEIQKHGSVIYYVKYSLKNFFKFRSKFKAILKQNNYVAVHDHQDFITGWHLLAGAGNLPPVKISHLHNPFNFVRNYVVSPGRWLSFKLGRLLTVGFVSKITGTSDSVMNEYGYSSWPYNNKRASPAYCGFDTYKFKYDALAKREICGKYGWNSDECKIALFVGRIGLQNHDVARNQKNPEFALEVAKQLVSSYSNWCFLFVGLKGKAGEEMEEDVRVRGLDNKIKFTGIRNDIPAIMSASEILVFPSLWEGLGMVSVEAQANGLPVIMSDNIPKEAIVFSELISTKKLGDSIGSWVESIEELSKHDYDRSEYASKMANTQFSIENSVTKLISLYTSANADR